MSAENKPLKLILAAEVGLACLFLVGVLTWQFLPDQSFVFGTQTPVPTASPSRVEFSANPSPTPFLPDSEQILIWGPGQNPPGIASAPPPFSDLESLPLPPTPIPGIIPTPAQAGELGPLNYAQQVNLYVNSLHYVAPTPGEALYLARELNFIGREGHPSNMCGPLALAILREAGLVSPETSLASFWLLNPRQGTAKSLLSRTFPAERFDHWVSQTSLKKFDWNASPLQPGDFLYLYAGPGGNFEHMLVVNRVDGQRRAFAVTNYATAEGFVIQERLLYDPNDKSLGLFAEWTQQPYALLGSTGFGGFEIWRLRQP